MEVVAVKSEELQQMSPVGADIDIVKNQLEEHKVSIDMYIFKYTVCPFMYTVLLQEFSESVNELKGQISAVQTAGKQLKESCSTQVKILSARYNPMYITLASSLLGMCRPTCVLKCSCFFSSAGSTQAYIYMAMLCTYVCLLK